MVTAHVFASLSHKAQNRIILGLGAGAGSSHLCYCIGLDHLAAKLEEGIKAIQSLWTATPEKPVTFNGRYFKLKKVGAPLKPVGIIPIYVASYGPKMIEVTAKFADGWIPESHSPSTYKVTLENVYARMKKVWKK